MGYHYSLLVDPILMAGPKPLLTEFGTHHRLERVACSICHNFGLKYCSFAASPELEGAHDVDSSGRDAVTGEQSADERGKRAQPTKPTQRQRSTPVGATSQQKPSPQVLLTTSSDSPKLLHSLACSRLLEQLHSKSISPKN